MVDSVFLVVIVRVEGECSLGAIVASRQLWAQCGHTKAQASHKRAVRGRANCSTAISSLRANTRSARVRWACPNPIRWRSLVACAQKAGGDEINRSGLR